MIGSRQYFSDLPTHHHHFVLLVIDTWLEILLPKTFWIEKKLRNFYFCALDMKITVCTKYLFYDMLHEYSCLLCIFIIFILLFYSVGCVTLWRVMKELGVQPDAELKQLVCFA